MKEIEIVKIGYEELTLDTLYHRLTCVLYESLSDYTVSDLEREKENVKKETKKYLSYYYLKDSLLKEPLNRLYIIDFIMIKKESYKIVKIPQEELKLILLKNKLGGYLTFTNIVQEEEFDKTFEELYQELIDREKQGEHVSF